MHKLQWSWVRSSHPSAQWNLKAADEAVLNIVRKIQKNTKKHFLSLLITTPLCANLNIPINDKHSLHYYYILSFGLKREKQKMRENAGSNQL
jgi:hypothetical protein